MKQDDTCRITMLNAHFETHACRCRRVAKCRDQDNALSRLPPERPIFRHRVHDGQFRVMRAAEDECVIEGGPRSLRKIDGGQNMTKLIHVAAPNPNRGMRNRRISQSFKARRAPATRKARHA
jgi:hypothetical protein